MLTLDTRIAIAGVETTPRDWMASIGYYIHPELVIMCHDKEISMHTGFFEAEDTLLELFHDHINNKRITYEII